MKKIPLTLAAVALFGLSACGGGTSAANGKLIPEQATILGGVDVAGLMKSKVFTDAKPDVEKNSDWQSMSKAAKDCNLDPEKAISSITFGTDGGSGVAAVITGEGLGDEKNLTCVADKMKNSNGKVPFTVVEENGKKVLKSDDGDGTGFIVDGKTIAFASKPWEAAVKELIDGKGKSAFDGANKALFDRADKSKHVWFAGVAPAQLAGMAKNAGAEPKDFVGSFDMSSGVATKIAVTVASPEQAAEAKKKADEGIGMLKGLAAMSGMQVKAMDSIVVTSKDATVTVEASISNDEIKQLVEKSGGYGAILGNGGGSAPPPAAPPAAAPPADPAAPTPAN